MKLKNDISEELKSISPDLANLPGMANYSLPEGYFSLFYNRLQIKIASLQSLQETPKDYFTTFPNKILDRIHAESIVETGVPDEISPLLLSLKSKPTYSIPEGYFENLAPNVGVEKPLAVVRPLFSKSFIWKQLAAAVITGVIAVSALWNFNQTTQSGLAQSGENSSLAASIDQSKQFKSEEEINNGIAQLPSDDIVKYLAFNSSESDIENVISNINESDLPVQDPTKSDEKPINNYLNN